MPASNPGEEAPEWQDESARRAEKRNTSVRKRKIAPSVMQVNPGFGCGHRGALGDIQRDGPKAQVVAVVAKEHVFVLFAA